MSTVSSLRPNSDYTVGWICALETELIAARVFLDNIHAERAQERGKNDNNTYLLGDAEGHNVVVAVLPAGVYGTASAAHVARDMLRSFENVRIGLMVGIGGGAPSSQHNIHLGDVIVSVPQTSSNGGGGSGVFQYKFGKNIQGDEFQYTGHLDKPPQILLTAVAGLNTRFTVEGNRIDDCVQSVLEKRPRLVKRFKRPPTGSDRLYVANYKHQQAHAENTVRQSCEITCGTDPSNLVDRDGWEDRDDITMVYQGIVASADQLMKNATDRDNLSRKHGVLCFEMEAAGLMNNFPCLVVRGICDYSDTHKNDAWHGYAAMSAAAYAKQLLSQIAPSSIETQQKLIDSLNIIERSLEVVENTTSATHETITSMNTSKKRSKLKKWLCPFDGSVDHVEARKQRHPSSGEWLIADPRFQEWLDGAHTFLWLFGLPGCGKTVLSSTIIDHVAKTSTCLYFYITFRERETLSLDVLLQTIIWQLSSQCEAAALVLRKLYTQCRNEATEDVRKPKTDELIATFEEMLRLKHETWVIIDALDEFLTDKNLINFKSLLNWLEQIVLAKHSNLHLLVTSRDENEIRDGLKALTSPRTCISIEGQGLDSDISDYIQARVSQSRELQRWKVEAKTDDDMRKMILSKLLDQAGGMFRYIACQIDQLEMCISPDQLREALMDLPKDLNETYSRIMGRVFDRFKLDTVRILRLLIYSARPLRVDELIDAIAVHAEKSPSFETRNRIPRPTEIARCCSSLIKLVKPSSSETFQDEGALELHLAHFTVQEYLVTSAEYSQHFQETPSRVSIATICMSYLRGIDDQLGLWNQENGPRGNVWKRSQATIETEFPFFSYSSESWTSNAASTMEHDDSMFDQTMDFLLDFDLNYHDYWKNTTGWSNERLCISAFRHALEAGLSVRCLDHLLKHESFAEFDFDEAHSDRDLLSVACGRGDVGIVQFLLDKGAVANPGHLLISNLLEDVVKVLLASGGIEGDPQYENWAFVNACIHGKLNIARLLIEHDRSYVNTIDRESGPPLWIACSCGHEDVALLLLENGADLYIPEGQDFLDKTPLLDVVFDKGLKRVLEEVIKICPTLAKRKDFTFAAETGNSEFIQMLWNSGEFQEEDLNEALWFAAKCEKEDMVRLLLQLGADARIAWREKSDEKSQTPLQMTQALGHVGVASVLVDWERQ